MNSEVPPLHFLHIGKSGGTAIKHALGPIAPIANVVFHPHWIQLGRIPTGERVFFFLRHPLSRFISGFYSRQREGRPRYVAKWTPDEAEAFGHFRTPGELAGALSANNAAVRESAERAMRGIGHVRARYWDWLVDPSYLQSRAGDLYFIGLQENLTDDFATLKARLGIAPGVSLPDDDINAHRNPTSLDRSLDEQASRNLADWYAEDFVAMRECRRIARERGLGGAIVDADWISDGR